MEKKMFYKSPPVIFQMAKQLRKEPTHAEMLLWNFLKKRPLGYKFRRQHPLHNYIVDFFCFELQLVIEVDGSVHQHQDVMMKDIDRQEYLESKNIKILRITNKDVIESLDKVIIQIQSYLGAFKPQLNE
jgi:very-short-patch-repair endonuclease